MSCAACYKASSLRLSVQAKTNSQLTTPNSQLLPMFPNRRIFLNIVATYGRSLYAVVCGRFIGRWAGGGWNDRAV